MGKDGEDEVEEKRNSTYPDFWKTFATDIRYGCFEDDANRGKISKLLRFDSSWTLKSAKGKTTSLDGYVSRMLEKQTMIYYAAGDNAEAIANTRPCRFSRRRALRFSSSPPCTTSRACRSLQSTRVTSSSLSRRARPTLVTSVTTRSVSTI